MKVRTAVRKMCKDCKVVRRGKQVRVICKSNPRHKQRAGRKLHTSATMGVGWQQPIQIPTAVQLPALFGDLSVLADMDALSPGGRTDDDGT